MTRKELLELDSMAPDLKQLSNQENIVEAYIYSIWDGTLKIYKGIVKRWISIAHPYPNADDISAFFKNDRRRFKCSPAPGVVTSAVVWFPKRDDNLAIEILVEYNTNLIGNLYDKIEKCQSKIVCLREGVSNEIQN